MLLMTLLLIVGLNISMLVYFLITLQENQDKTVKRVKKEVIEYIENESKYKK